MTKIRSICFLLAGISIIFLMVYFVGVEDVVALLSQVDPLIFTAAVVCEIIAVFLWSLKWRILLNSFKPVSMKNTVKGILIGMFFNNITPVTRAGGEPLRAYFMERKEGVNFSDAFATAAVDRILDSFPFMIAISISLIYFMFMNIGIKMLIIILFALLFNVIILSLALYFSLSLKAAKKLMFSILRFVAMFSNRLEKYESKIEAAVEQYHGAIRTLSAQGGNLVSCLFISFGFWFMTMLRGYLVVIALGYEVDFIVIVVVQMVGALVGAVPVLPGGLGSIDGIMVFLYYSFHFPAPVAMTASLVDRFISFWIMTAVGGACVITERAFLQKRDTQNA